MRADKLFREFEQLEPDTPATSDAIQQLCIARGWNTQSSFSRYESNPFMVKIAANGKTFEGLSSASMLIAWLRAYVRACKLEEVGTA